jgi:LPS-assembly protein
MAPSYFRNTIFGLGFRTPYYVNIAPNKDLTVTPIFYPSSKQYIVTNDFRHISDYGDYKMQLEIANNNVVNTNNTTVVKRTTDKYRGSIISKGKFDFTTNLGADFDINTISDRDYMRDYHFSYWAYSLSVADLHYIKKRDYYSIKSLRIQELENTSYQNAAPIVLPSFDSRVESEKSIFSKEKFALSSNVTTIIRRDGLEYRRATAIPEVNVPFNLNGNLFAINSKVQTDLYWLENNYKNTPQTAEYQSLQTNYKPEISTSWRLPLIKKTPKNTFMIEPMANFISSTYRKQFSKLPNEDSSNSELTVSNLFLSDRIYGFDRNEAGQRSSYGVKSSLFNQFGEFGLTAGQSYRLKNREQDVNIRGFSDNNFSNYIGQAMYKARRYFTLTYSFQLNQSNFSNDVNQLTASFDAGTFIFSSDYLLLRKSDQNTTQREQLNFNTTFKIGGPWKANLIATKDLVTGRMVSRSINLLRDGCCTVFNFMIMESNPINFTKPQRTFSFLLTFKNI